MKVYNNILELIGNTPIVKINNINTTKANIFVKMESFNPFSSAKDRVGLAMVERAEKEGILKKGGVIIEPTSGNTGIALAGVAAVKGYKLILTMPETMSVERRMLLASLGAEIVLTEGARGMNGAVEKAKELLKEMPNAFMPQQFENDANSQIHYETTAKEIFESNDITGKQNALLGLNDEIELYSHYMSGNNFLLQIYRDDGTLYFENQYTGKLDDNMIDEMKLSAQNALEGEKVTTQEVDDMFGVDAPQIISDKEYEAVPQIESVEYEEMEM